LGEREQLRLDHLDRGLEPGQLGVELLGPKAVARHVALARLEHARATDDDATADAGAVDAEHRSSVPIRPVGSRAIGYERSSSRYSSARRGRSPGTPSSARSSTRRILPEIVFGSSAN